MKRLRKLYYRFFKHYRRLEGPKLFTYADADKLLRENGGKKPSEQWAISKEEDTNFAYGFVWLERKERITE